MQGPNSSSQGRSYEVVVAFMAVFGVAGLLVLQGWIGPDIDVWYGAGLVRALSERPLSPESLGHVPKLAHLVLLSPAAALGSAPEWWLALVGVVALLVTLWSHWRWATGAGLAPARLTLALAIAPLLWRATLDGGSVAWGWACVVLALTSRMAGQRRSVAWLSLGALFRPECMGVAIALGLRDVVSGSREGWRTAVIPLLIGTLGTLTTDLVWSGAVGASSIAHGIFESLRLEQVRGRFGFADSGHPWLQLSIPLVVAGVIGIIRSTRTSESTGSPLTRDFLVSAVGFSAVSVVNLFTGGTMFVRFLFPWVSVLAVFAVSVVPERAWPRTAVLVATVAAAMIGWQIVAPEFVGTYPTADALIVARRVARATAPQLVVAMDAGARAVSLGSGARPWKTTPWLLQSPETPCQSQVIVARAALLVRMDTLALNRCGPWRDFVVDSAQARVNLRVLLARRGAAPTR